MKLSKLMIAVLTLVVARSTAVLAQNAPGEYLLVYDIRVQPGANAQFEDYIKKIGEAADKTGAPQTWGVFQGTIGGPGNRYLITLQFDQWEAIDGWDSVPGMLSEAFGEEEAAKIQRSGGMAIESSETRITSLMHELSYNLKAAGPAPMYRVRVIELRRDMQRDFRVFLQRLNEAWEKAGDKRVVIRRESLMGPSAVYSSAIPFEKWSEWDDRSDVWGMIEDAHGPAETRRLQDVLEKCIEHSELFTIQLRPDLTRSRASATSNE